jgi:hypothetical protein
MKILSAVLSFVEWVLQAFTGTKSKGTKMGASDITVSSLTVNPSVRGNILAWAYSDARNGTLPNLSLDAVEVWASTTNDRTGATKVGEGITTFTHSGLVEEATWYYWTKARDKSSGYGAWYPSGSTSGVSCKAAGQASTSFAISNGKLIASVSSNALTVQILTAGGSTPSVSDPVYVAFHNTSAGSGSGAYTTIAITSAMSLTISAGSTLGTANAVPFKLWAVLFNDGGTLRLGIINCIRTDTYELTIRPLVEYLQAATALAEGGAGAADSGGQFYASQDINNRSYRVLGYMEWEAGQVTAGTWASLPTWTEMFTTGSHLPGDIIQEISLEDSQAPTSTTIIPFDNTIPQSTEGATILGASISQCTSFCNVLEIQARINCSYSVAAHVMMALFRTGSGANALFACAQYVAASDQMTQLEKVHRELTNTAGTATVDLRAGGSTAGTLYVNGTSAGRKLGGVMSSELRLREIMA